MAAIGDVVVRSFYYFSFINQRSYNYNLQTPFLLLLLLLLLLSLFLHNFILLLHFPPYTNIKLFTHKTPTTKLNYFCSRETQNPKIRNNPETKNPRRTRKAKSEPKGVAGRVNSEFLSLTFHPLSL